MFTMMITMSIWNMSEISYEKFHRGISEAHTEDTLHVLLGILGNAAYCMATIFITEWNQRC